MDDVKITVVIAHFEQPHFIEDAIRSVACQSLKDNVEILIVDDCSRDDSINVIRQLIKKYNVENRSRILVNKKNVGYGVTLDRGIREAKADLVAIVDADDALANDDALKIEMDVHIKYPEASLVYSNFILCDKDLRPKRVYKTRSFKRGEFYLDGKVRVSHFKMLKRKCYEMTEGINPKLRQTVDKDLNLRLEEVGRLVYIDADLIYYRHHKNSLIRTLKKKSPEYQQFVTKMRKQIREDAVRRRLEKK